MRVIRDIAGLHEIKGNVLTIGTFDGVHVGHQKIINKLNEEAERIGGESTLFTFYPHPRMVLYPDSHGVKLIQTEKEKIDKLSASGLKNLIIFPFTMEFSRLSALEFVRDFLVNQLDVKTLVIGYDHQFGRNREGSIDFLNQVAPTYGFKVIEISAQDIDEVNVSSTKIRNAIKAGDFETANTYLGDAFQLTGKVVKGKQLGRTIGFPTANLEVEEVVKLIPGNGVYLAKALVHGRNYQALVNIGVNPTVGVLAQQQIEVYILDFSSDLYGQEITVQFLRKLREEQKFDSLALLKQQLESDEKVARNFFDHK